MLVELFFSYLNFTLITIDNIYHSQNVSSHHYKTLICLVMCSHSAATGCIGIDCFITSEPLSFDYLNKLDLFFSK
jgi:hypothetical protein